jgi:hypothetical protein
LKYDGTTWQNTVTGNANAPQGYLSDLFFDKNNNLWAASWYDGLYRFDGNTWQHWTDLNSDLPHNNTQAITSDGDSTIFVGTDSGLAAFDGTNWQVWTQDNSGLCNDDVTFIEFLKNEQQLWIGTEQGLCVYQFATVGTQPTAQLAPSMRVFPNPLETSATLEFQTKQPINDAHLKIVTTTGQVITDIILPKYEVGTHQIELKREQLAAGMYFLVLQFNGQSFMQSLLVR